MRNSPSTQADQYEGLFGIFISHASPDRHIAEAVATLLTENFPQRVHCVYSSAIAVGSGIQYGQPWLDWIKRHVDGARLVVVILTAHSVLRPWLLFEAGLARADEDKKIVALAIGVDGQKAFTGPFSAFQNLSATKLEIEKLIKELQKEVGFCQTERVVALLVKEFLVRIEDLALETVPESGPDGNERIAEALKQIDSRLAGLEAGEASRKVSESVVTGDSAEASALIVEALKQIDSRLAGLEAGGDSQNSSEAFVTGQVLEEQVLKVQDSIVRLEAQMNDRHKAILSRMETLKASKPASSGPPLRDSKAQETSTRKYKLWLREAPSNREEISQLLQQSTDHTTEWVDFVLRNLPLIVYVTTNRLEVLALELKLGQLGAIASVSIEDAKT